MLSAAVRHDLAGRLSDAERNHVPIAPISGAFPEIDLVDAYEIQLINIRRRTEAGARVVGHKVGLTAKVMQEAIGVDEPDYGHLLDDMHYDEYVPVDASGFFAPRVEIELAFVLGKDLSGRACTVDEVLDATEFVTPSIELIDSRIRDWEITVVDTVADNASAVGFLLGQGRSGPREIDLTRIDATLRANGEVVAEGRTDAVLGHPARAVAWLAERVVRFGVELKAGDVILPGSCTRAVDAHAGDEFVAEFAGLGEVRVAIK
ncbi:2-keto-4-pentenoate hydratase [Rhodococcus sp. D2-41]|uniref:2-keto-4-pentenoate hydratase n=1 Tax=Speluncibacter jeojiensis TaxID=2710754 RepID=A0A9X4RHK1_9ACTN|nr:2-keto-4-pentenoate hydratase [Rhodococcus sp. D2-41]MDG3011458.1 2-keto-4-pentenoate hydratase [Rhodococcus sp. D2-41]MDG3015186.1 2-keto-4-pentenoate hydratase [Corynebacteriales bacterium D3-21]